MTYRVGLNGFQNVLRVGISNYDNLKSVLMFFKELGHHFEIWWDLQSVFGLILHWKPSNSKICSQETRKFYFLVSGKCSQGQARWHKESTKSGLHSGRNEENIKTSSCCWCQFIPSAHKTCLKTVKMSFVR